MDREEERERGREGLYRCTYRKDPPPPKVGRKGGMEGEMAREGEKDCVRIVYAPIPRGRALTDAHSEKTHLPRARGLSLPLHARPIFLSCRHFLS